ncbi:fatty acid cis/trans isomerase [Planctobacterium marinum]|uniref:9-hexadecenoic acid cis-trans isomerase n=1 Tax=Planctobacterium marinum TaxID=1631968 RepID=A0AA48HKI1_9ALTE|nr:9-hexadecenoic acid cis-trans isomerase [Planctobacterium marinum]
MSIVKTCLSKATFASLMVLFFGFISIAQEAGSAPVRGDNPSQEQSLSYQSSVKTILDNRCVVCHGCYDAPCQLKLGSYEGIMRGAHHLPVYDGERLTAATPTRLFEDASDMQQWRELGFYSVVGEDNNLMLDMLLQKQHSPLPDTKKLPESFNLDINRPLSCPTPKNYQQYAKQNPLWGMPYGLPALNQEEHQTLSKWLLSGMQRGTDLQLTEDEQQAVKRWEKYFNNPSLKGRLVARYLYEHLFLAHLYFTATANEKPNLFFKLIRSRTPPGTEPDIIAARRPFDAPGTETFYYRVVPVSETIVDKLHMPFHLSDSRMEKWDNWFFEQDYDVTSLPGYEPKTASNPFITFAQIPTQSRYRFMLDEAQYSIMQFIKGAVCRGQIALNVINDHFWVVFADPDLVLPEYDEAFMQKARATLLLPAEAQSNALPTNWLAYAKRERSYLKLKSEYIKEHVEKSLPINVNLLWDGDGENDNSSLTIFRHFDAASVVKGLVGENPQTAWIITYPLFERIHYLLVAGYDVYGNMGHQLNSRMYMDFLRMEGEYNFLALLPKDARESVRQQWYRGSVSMVEKYVYEGNAYQPETDIEFTSKKPLSELHQIIKAHVGNAESQRHFVKAATSNDTLKAAKLLNNVKGNAAAIMPQASLILVTSESEPSQLFSLLSHNAYSNISHLFGEMDRRLPNEDTLTFAPGVMTSHPNALFSVPQSELQSFAKSIIELKSEKDYAKLLTNWGVRRTNPYFWQFSDKLHDSYRKDFPVEFGYFDFNRLENR